MPRELIFLVFLTIVLITFAAKSLAVTKEGERLIVFRLGKLFGVYRPGLTLLIPFIDKGVKIRVDQIAGWETFSESELKQKLIQAVIRKLE